MSIRAKVMGSFLAILFLFGGVSFYNYLRSRHSNERLASVNELFLPLSRQVVQLQGSIHGWADEIRRVYFNSVLSTESNNYSRVLRDIFPLSLHKRITGVEQLLGRHENGPSQSTVGELLLMLHKARTTLEQMTVANDKQKFETSYVELKSQLQALSRRVDDECQKITLTAQSEGRDNLLANLMLSAMVVGFGVVSSMLSHKILMPLPALIDSIKKIADGDFHQGLKVRTSDKDEVASLAREYNRMLEALRERDVQIKQQQKELLDAERLAAVGQLSAEVVHEIRNPLNSISLNMDWLESEISHEDPEITKTVKSISREIERLNQITESYLVRARVPTMEMDHKTPVNDLLLEILDFTREEDRQRNIEIETDFAGQEIFVRTDRSKLKQAFLNVLKNAKEAMPRGGVIHVKTEVRDNLFQVQFRDNGHGMNESTRRMSFQPFFTTKPNGTGLGLMLTKSIVEEAQGTVHCESQMGRGTTFRFQFPV